MVHGVQSRQSQVCYSCLSHASHDAPFTCFQFESLPEAGNESSSSMLSTFLAFVPGRERFLNETQCPSAHQCPWTTDLVALPMCPAFLLHPLAIRSTSLTKSAPVASSADAHFLASCIKQHRQTVAPQPSSRLLRAGKHSFSVHAQVTPRSPDSMGKNMLRMTEHLFDKSQLLLHRSSSPLTVGIWRLQLGTRRQPSKNLPTTLSKILNVSLSCTFQAHPRDYHCTGLGRVAPIVWEPVSATISSYEVATVLRTMSTCGASRWVFPVVLIVLF